MKTAKTTNKAVDRKREPGIGQSTDHQFDIREADLSAELVGKLNENLAEILSNIEANHRSPAEWTSGARTEAEKFRKLAVVHKRLADAAVDIIESGDALGLTLMVSDRSPYLQRADRILDSMDLHNEKPIDPDLFSDLCVAMYRSAEMDVNAVSDLADIEKASGDAEIYSGVLFRLQKVIRQMRFAAVASLVIR